MGFFDRFAGKRTEAGKPAEKPAAPEAQAAPAPAPAVTPGGVMGQLAAARKKLEAGDVPGAVAVYEEVLAGAGDRPDILVTISGDLGSTGNVVQIIELVAPRYDAARHGPATGLNLLQAYLAVNDASSAQHVLDILFSLNRPELEERLYGFSNAIADLMASATPAAAAAGGPAGAEPVTMAMTTFSKPVWLFGLEPMMEDILPKRVERPRRIAFAQLSLPGAYKDPFAAMKLPEDDLSRLARGIPLWLTEMFYFSEHYSPVFASGLVENPGAAKTYCIFSGDWVSDNIQRIVAESEGGLDYIYSGVLRHRAGDYELVLKLFEVRKFRERKTFTVRWNPATADEELNKLHAQIRTFMEWSGASTGLQYSPPARPLSWAMTLAASLSTFLADKGYLAKSELPRLAGATDGNPATELEALAYLTLADRAGRLGIPMAPPPVLPDTGLVRKARSLLGS